MSAQLQYYQPLIWIKPELDQTIKNIRSLLEEYSFDLEIDDALTKIPSELHLLKGSLEILEFFGAGLLVEDMKKAVFALIDNKISEKTDVFESLLQATLSIEAYVDHLHKDHNDIPLTLLPVLNDIRASINEPLLSESALFLPNLSIVPKTPENIANAEDRTSLQTQAKTLRPYYQAALLTWYKNPNDQLSLQQLKLVVRNLESASVTSRNRQIWWILGGIFEALTDKGLKSNIALRLILGQADRIIKTLSESDEDIYEKNPPIDLLKNALYYVSQAKSEGDRVDTLKRVYQLSRVIPSEKDLSELRAALNSANSSTLASIAKELKKSLDQSKAVIDNFARNTPNDTGRLASVITPLKLIADTLTLLSLSDEKDLLNIQIKKISHIVETETPPDKETLFSIATSLLQLDSALQNINKTSRKKHDWQHNKSKNQIGDDMSNNSIVNKLPESEYRLLIIKTAIEAKHNITKIKNNILVYLATQEINSSHLNNIPDLLFEIEGSLIILNNPYAASIVSALKMAVKELLLDVPKKDLDLDALAEAIVSIEYYFEAVAEERSPTDPILEITQNNLSKLGYPVDPPKLKNKTIPTLEAVVTHISTAPPRLRVNALSLPSMSTNASEKEKNDLTAPQDDIDPEVVVIFIEEAFEVLTNMDKHLKSLKLNPLDADALTNITQAVHTLKGSGKIAGAHDISDFSAVIEKFIGQVLCGALKLDQNGIRILHNSQQFLFELTDCLKRKLPAPEELEILTTIINNALISNKTADENEKVSSKVSDQLPQNTSHQTKKVEFDSDELDELLKSAATQLNIIDNYIENTKSDSLTPLLDAIQRLHNVAIQTQLTEFIQTSDLLSKYLNNFLKNNTSLSSECIEILKEFSSTTYEILLDLPKTLTLNIKKPEKTNILKQTADLNLEIKPKNIEPKNTTSKQPDSNPVNIPVEEKNHPQNKNVEHKELNEDLDLIDIFMEEAIELIAKGNSIIEDFDSNKDVSILLSAIQRLLHTMKGSARMAGITSVGNLAHKLESLIELIIFDNTRRPNNLVELIQNTLDAISDITEDIISDKDIRLHHDLIDEIESVLAPKEKPTIPKEKPLDPAYNNEKASQLTGPKNQKTLESKNTLVEDALAIKPPSKMILNDEPINSTLEETSHTSNVIVRAMEKSAQQAQERAEAINDDKNKDQNITPPIDSLPPLTNEYLYENISSVSDNNEEIKKEHLIDNIRVDASELDSMINMANEGSATNNRIEDHIDNIKSNLLELDKTISRSLIQMRDLQFDNQKDKNTRKLNEYNPLRDSNDLTIFSTEQQNHQRLMESLSDIENIHVSLTRAMLETDNLVHQQKKLQSELYEKLLSSRLVTFSIQTQRIQRILRQTCRSLNKKAKLTLEGTDGSIDRSLLEKLMGPIEHIIRNAIAHGIESTHHRKQTNKQKTGNVTVSFSKELSEHVISVRDDGAGIDIDKVRQKAITLGLVEKDEDICDEDIKHLIFESGFSTCQEISQISGRGIGMDVVLNEVQRLGGTVNIDSQAGEGSNFIIRVPFTSSRNHTLFVSIGENTYALPSTNIVRSFPVNRQRLEKMYASESPNYEFEGKRYPLWYMDALLNETPTFLPTKTQHAHIVLLEKNNKLLALHVDSIRETRDSVLQPSNPQLSAVQGIAGTTVLGDGKVILIIDIPAILKLSESKLNKPVKLIFAEENIQNTSTINALIVDDSITVRKVTERFLSRYGMNTTSAKDGIEALEKIQIEKPDVVLLDIEMPNMDGLELAKAIKTDKRLHSTPIIMITSRTGQHHRENASNIGVEVFLGKPYQESELLGYIQALTGKRTSLRV